MRIEPYSLFLLWSDGVIVAAQRETKTVFTDDEGNVIAERPNAAEPIPLDLGEEILGEVNAGLLARNAELEAAIQELNSEHAAAIQAIIAEHAAEIERIRAEHAAEIEQVRAESQPSSPPVLTVLGQNFATLPEEIQVTFAAAFAIVRTLVQGGRNDLAAAYVAGLEVPEDLITTRDAIVATLRE